MFNNQITEIKYIAKKVLIFISCLRISRGNLHINQFSNNKKLVKSTLKNLTLIKNDINAAREIATFLSTQVSPHDFALCRMLVEITLDNSTLIKSHVQNILQIAQFFCDNNIAPPTSNSWLMQIFLKNKKGNCEELSNFTLVLLSYLSFNGHMSLCRGKNFDHVFIVITQDVNYFLTSPLEVKFQDLPNSFLILDPWLNVYFYPSQANSYLTKIAANYQWGAVENLTFIIQDLKSVQSYKEIPFISDTLKSTCFQHTLLEIKQAYLNNFHINCDFYNSTLYRKNYFQNDDALQPSSQQSAATNFQKKIWLLSIDTTQQLQEEYFNEINSSEIKLIKKLFPEADHTKIQHSFQIQDSQKMAFTAWLAKNFHQKELYLSVKYVLSRLE